MERCRYIQRNLSTQILLACLPDVLLERGLGLRISLFQAQRLIDRHGRYNTALNQRQSLVLLLTWRVAQRTLTFASFLRLSLLQWICHKLRWSVALCCLQSHGRAFICDDPLLSCVVGIDLLIRVERTHAKEDSNVLVLGRDTNGASRLFH